MTPEEAKAEQDRLAHSGFRLEWWYGTDCTQCCGVFPKFRRVKDARDLCYYECQVCGKRTAAKEYPWLARDAWNHGYTFREKDSEQLTLF